MGRFRQVWLIIAVVGVCLSAGGMAQAQDLLQQLLRGATQEQGRRPNGDVLIGRVGGDEQRLSATQRRQIQQALQTRSFLSGKADGQFGQGTRRAIGAYQASRGENPTGYLNRDQIADLLSGPRTQPKPPQTFASTRFNMLSGYDLPGNDLRTDRGVSLAQCEAACSNNAACSAFTYNTEYSACIQKSAIGQAKPFTAAISGQRKPAQAQVEAVADFTVHPNTDMPGGDIRSGQTDPALKGIDFAACQRLCLAHATGCSGVTHYNGVCMLKNPASQPVPFAGAMSAVRLLTQRAPVAVAPPASQIPTADLAWRDDDTEQNFVARIRAAAKPMGGECHKERLDFSAIADGVRFGDIAPTAIAANATAITWTQTGPTARMPAYIMVTADQPVRFEGKGYYALLPDAIAPFGLSVASGQTRAIVALYGEGVEASGAINIVPLVAGPLRITANVVGYFRACEEEILREARSATVMVRPSPSPTFFVNDPFSLDAPTKTLVNTTGTRHAQIFDNRYRLVDVATGAVLAEREGARVSFSPTGRFLAAFNGSGLDVVDSVDGELAVRTRSGDVGWENADSFVVIGAAELNNWGTVTVRNPTATGFEFEQGIGCRICNGAASEFRNDLENNVLYTGANLGLAANSLTGKDFIFREEPTVSAAGDARELTQPLFSAAMQKQGMMSPLYFPASWNLRGGIKLSHWSESRTSDSGGDIDQLSAKMASYVIKEIEAAKPGSDVSSSDLSEMANLGSTRGALALSANASVKRDTKARLGEFGLRFSLEAAPIFSYAGNTYADMENNAKAGEDVLRRIVQSVPQAASFYKPREDYLGCRHTNGELYPEFSSAQQFETAGRSIWLSLFSCAEGTAQFYASTFSLIDPASDEVLIEIDGKNPDSDVGTECYGSISYCSFDARLYGGKYLLIWSVESRAIMIYDIDAKQPIYKNFNLGRSDLFKEAYYSLEDRMVTQVNSDGSFFVYDVDANRQVLEGRYVDDELIAWTPSLRFDATSEGANYVNLRFPGQSIQYTFQQFAEKVRQPGLVKAVFDRSPAAPTVDVGLPPQIQGALAGIGSDRIQGTINLATPSAGAQLAVFQDGLRTDTIAAPDGLAIDIDVARARGARWVSVLASDDNGLASLPIGRDLGNPAALPVVHALAIGVDNYKTLPKLNFGAADARTLVASLQAQNGKSLALVGSQVLDQEGLSRETIIGAVRALVDTAKPGETIVLSYAGHGLTAPDGGFFMSTSATDVNDIAGTSVAWSEIAGILAGAKARVLVFLDACHSGSAGANYFASNDDAADSVLARISSGILVFSASKGRQLSEETSSAGGGVFTNAVADVITRQRQTFDTNGNGAIEISELYAGVKLRVVGQTQGRQTPWLSRNQMVGDFALF